MVETFSITGCEFLNLLCNTIKFMHVIISCIQSKSKLKVGKKKNSPQQVRLSLEVQLLVRFFLYSLLSPF